MTFFRRQVWWCPPRKNTHCWGQASSVACFTSSSPSPPPVSRVNTAQTIYTQACCLYSTNKWIIPNALTTTRCHSRTCENSNITIATQSKCSRHRISTKLKQVQEFHTIMFYNGHSIMFKKVSLNHLLKYSLHMSDPWSQRMSTSSKYWIVQKNRLWSGIFNQREFSHEIPPCLTNWISYTAAMLQTTFLFIFTRPGTIKIQLRIEGQGLSDHTDPIRDQHAKYTPTSS
jgi:hypothetical protein